LQAHCQSPASHCSSQSFVKELAKSTQEKLFLKNFPTLQKNKKRNAQPDKDRQKSKQTMTLKPNTVNGLQGRTTEHQLPTFIGVPEIPSGISGVLRVDCNPAPRQFI
jgi:hypothetical protein